MSQRETHIYHQSVSSTINLSFDEMVRLANSLKKSTSRYIKKKEYSCIVLISVCCIDIERARIRVGFRGKKSIVRKKGYKDCDPTVNPHLHIVTFANPGETISKYIHNYIEKKLKGKSVWSTHAHQEKSWKTYLRYDFEQAMKNRTICHNVETLPQDRVEGFLDYCEYLNFHRNGNVPVFCGISDEYFKKYHNQHSIVENDPFTLLENQNTEKHLITRELETDLENINYYNVIYSNNKLNKLNNSYKPDDFKYTPSIITTYLRRYQIDTS